MSRPSSGCGCNHRGDVRRSQSRQFMPAADEWTRGPPRHCRGTAFLRCRYICKAQHERVQSVGLSRHAKTRGKRTLLNLAFAAVPPTQGLRQVLRTCGDDNSAKRKSSNCSSDEILLVTRSLEATSEFVRPWFSS